MAGVETVAMLAGMRGMAGSLGKAGEGWATAATMAELRVLADSMVVLMESVEEVTGMATMEAAPACQGMGQEAEVGWAELRAA